MSVFNTKVFDATKQPMFLGEPVAIARYDKQRYPWLEKLTEKQLSFFWQPTEVDLVKDARDFKGLSEHEKHIFTSNIKRQILLDSVQGRAPLAAFGPCCSLPELEAWLTTWTHSEMIHSRSYTHVLRNVYPDPSKVFDELMEIQEIVDCAKDISEHYDALTYQNWYREAYSNQDMPRPYSEYEHKAAIWLALMSVNILEGVRFYVSFACSWAFAETKRMEGNAKIIKLIAKDENLHLAGTQQMIKALKEDDDDFKKIAEETKEQVYKLFMEAVDQEKAWAKYLFHGGSMIGLNESLLCDYVDWVARRRMVAVGVPLPRQYGMKSPPNPLPWTQHWISGQNVQVAPQETEITSYTSGDIKKDVEETTFKGFRL